MITQTIGTYETHKPERKEGSWRMFHLDDTLASIPSSLSASLASAGGGASSFLRCKKKKVPCCLLKISNDRSGERKTPFPIEAGALPDNFTNTAVHKHHLQITKATGEGRICDTCTGLFFLT
jgi:hypothetical protein